MMVGKALGTLKQASEPSLQVKAEEKTVKLESASTNHGGGKSSTDERDITEELN